MSRDYSELNVLHPDAGRIAKEAGGRVLEEYTTSGLACFREIVPLGDDGESVIINEGYLRVQPTPGGGQKLVRVVTRMISLEEAQTTR